VFTEKQKKNFDNAESYMLPSLPRAVKTNHEFSATDVRNFAADFRRGSPEFGILI